MPLWGPDDTFSRWLQLICGIPLLLIGAAVEYYWWTTPYYGYSHSWRSYGGLGMMLLGIRCLWYAITGRNNVNRDDF